MKGAIMRVVYTVFTTVYTVFTYEGVQYILYLLYLRMRVYILYLRMTEFAHVGFAHIILRMWDLRHRALPCVKTKV